MKPLQTLMIVTLCILTMMTINPLAASAYQRSERQNRGAEQRAEQQSRRATEARDSTSRRAGMAADSARNVQRAARDSMRGERGDRPENRSRGERPERESREGRQTDPSEREARQADQDSRENDRGIRGRDRTPEELRSQLDNAKAQELRRHEDRMAQIGEIRTHAEESSNANALERIELLVEKENALHEKKMGKLLQLEEKFAQRMSGERPSRGENKNREAEMEAEGSVEQDQ